MSVRRTLAFRGDLLAEVGLTMLTLATSLIALGMVFTRTGDLNGWQLGEAVVLLGTFQIITGLRGVFVEPNMQWFNGRVKTGKLDEVLIQPAPTIFLVTLGTCAPLTLIQVFFGFAVVLFGIGETGETPTALAVVGWLVLLAAATAVTWATRVLVAAVAFWALGLELDVAYDAVWQFARYPIGIYPISMQFVFTYVLPIAFVATVPADVLLRGSGSTTILLALAVAIISCVFAWLIWRLGLRRYTSATS
jgi:ABC-2 type transport system permease protein